MPSEFFKPMFFLKKRSIKLILPAAILLSLSGCSWLFGDEGTFRDRSSDYREAKIEAPLQIPAGLDDDAIGDSYAIPPISDRTSLSDKFEIPAPEPIAEDVNRDSVRINTLGEQRWILVDGAPGQVWPRLRGFLSLNQLSVQRSDAVSGIIETSWLQPELEGALRERYRLRVDQGVQRGSSEVYVLQADLRAGENDWPKISSNAEREELMTSELAQYLADSAAAVAVSMLAQQAIDSSGRITLEEGDDKQVYIKLILPFARAWASLGKALNKSGFDIDDMDRSQHIYYLHYLQRDEDEEEPGFFSSLFSGSDDEESTDRGMAYHVRLNESESDVMIITIERQSGETMEEGEADKLLKLIKRHIS